MNRILDGDPADEFSKEVDQPLDTGSALESINRSEIDIQISTAHRFPRSIGKFKKDALAMATLDEETAGSCFYALKRKNADGSTKIIEGPSVRLAEIVGSAWGNLRYGARILSTDGSFVTAQGACHDLEKNNSANIEVRRRITGKDGRRYGDDMIGVTANAASSIALRNAIFKVVPFAYVKDIYEQAKLTAVGKGKTLQATRQTMFEHFAKMGVTEKMILDTMEKKTVEDLNLDDLIILRGFSTAIKDGDTTIEQTFHKKPSAKVVPPDEAKSLLIAHLVENFNYIVGEEEISRYIKALAKSMDLNEAELYAKNVEGLQTKEQFDYWKKAFESFISKDVQKKAKPDKEKKEKPAEKVAVGPSASLKSLRGKVEKYLSGLGLPSLEQVNAVIKTLSERPSGEFLDLDSLYKTSDEVWLEEILAKTKGA